jgi:hypothetical protein
LKVTFSLFVYISLLTAFIINFTSTDLLPEYSILVASQGVIWQTLINENQQKANISRMPFTQGFMIVAVAYDPKEKRMYWSDVNEQTIKRAYMDGTGEETILRYISLYKDCMSMP